MIYPFEQKDPQNPVPTVWVIHGSYDWDDFAELAATAADALKRVRAWFEGEIDPATPDGELADACLEAYEHGKWKSFQCIELPLPQCGD